MREFARVAYLFFPLLGGALLSGLCAKYGWLSPLAWPIDGGRLFRGKPIFGANKIYAGIVSAGVGNMLVLGIQTDVLHHVAWCRSLELFDYGRVNGWLLGLLVGVLASLSELPNSFAKRRIDVAPGALASGATRAIFYFMDQVDSVVGAWIGFSLALPATAQRVAASVVLLFFGHQLVSLVGYALGMRKTPH